jgi:hypothetical protein
VIAAALLTAALVTGDGRVTAVSAPQVVTYEIRPGDSLWAVTARRWGNPQLWPELYAANRGRLGSDPNLIYPGQRLVLRLQPLTRPVRAGARDTDPLDGGSAPGTVTPPVPRRGPGGTGGVTLSGQLGCHGLEALWEAAGGDPRFAFLAAEIAMAESGGYQYAHSPTDDYGYWQINGSHGALATYDPYGNARAAVIISADGTDWYPWTTYTSGVYAGRC